MRTEPDAVRPTGEVRFRDGRNPRHDGHRDDVGQRNCSQEQDNNCKTAPPCPT